MTKDRRKKEIEEIREAKVEALWSDTLGTVKVTNVSNKNIIHTYDGEPYGLKRGESSYMPNYLVALLLRHHGDSISIEGYSEKPKKEKAPTIPESAVLLSGEKRIKQMEEIKNKEIEDLKKEIEKLKKPEKLKTKKSRK